MSEQKFAARERYLYPNGAVGYRPGGPFDCLGPYAKVKNCPLDGTELRLTAYATGYADTYFSIPAVTRHRGRRITGYFTIVGDGDCVFMPHDRHKEFLNVAS